MPMHLPSLLTNEDGQASLQFYATMGGFFLIALCFVSFGAAQLSAAFLGQAPVMLPHEASKAVNRLAAMVPLR